MARRFSGVRVSDVVADGFRIFAVIDDFTREGCGS
jgi:hypothetical protein